MESPATLDELLAVLRAMKEKHPDAAPLNGAIDEQNPGYFILNAMGFVSRDTSMSGYGLAPATKDGNFALPCATEEFREYLTIMHDLYQEGILMKNFFLAEKTEVDAKVLNNETAVVTGAPYSYGIDTWDQWQAVSPLTSAQNDKAFYVNGATVNIGGMAFSAATEHPELLVRIADFFFSNRGGLYKWSGPWSQSEDTLGMIGGWSFEEGSNTKYYFEDVASGKYPSTFAAICSTIAPWGGSETFGYRKDINPNDGSHGSVWLMQEMAGLETVGKVYREDYGDDCWRMSREKNAMPYLTTEVYPNITYFTEDESIRINELRTMIEPYVETETAKFITGVRPIEEFDSYLKELEDMGAQELIDFYAKAYETYQANMEK